MVSAISLRNLTVATPQGQFLLNKLNFDLAKGERVGLIGASGSGKSLTAAMLCGLLRPPLSMTSGDLYLNGISMRGARPSHWRCHRGRNVFQIFQSPASALTPARRIGPQLEEAARIAGARVREVVPKVMDKLALSPDVVRQFPYQLSGGMKQRVLIAMALILRPAVLIADEPTTGLDILTELDILSALNDAVTETGATLLFISHDLHAVQEVADRVLVMQSGEIVEDGSIKTLGQSGAPAARLLAEAANRLRIPC